MFSLFPGSRISIAGPTFPPPAVLLRPPSPPLSFGRGPDIFDRPPRRPASWDFLHSEPWATLDRVPYILSSPLSTFWKSELSNFRRRCFYLLPFIYGAGMAGFALALPSRVFALVKEIIVTLAYILYDLYHFKQATFKNDLWRRVKVLTGTCLEIIIALFGTCCPPLAYYLDERLVDSPLSPGHSRWGEGSSPPPPEVYLPRDGYPPPDVYFPPFESQEMREERRRKELSHEKDFLKKAFKLSETTLGIIKDSLLREDIMELELNLMMLFVLKENRKKVAEFPNQDARRDPYKTDVEGKIDVGHKQWKALSQTIKEDDLIKYIIIYLEVKRLENLRPPEKDEKRIDELKEQLEALGRPPEPLFTAFMNSINLVSNAFSTGSQLAWNVIYQQAYRELP